MVHGTLLLGNDNDLINNDFIAVLGVEVVAIDVVDLIVLEAEQFLAGEGVDGGVFVIVVLERDDAPPDVVEVAVIRRNELARVEHEIVSVVILGEDQILVAFLEALIDAVAGRDYGVILSLAKTLIAEGIRFEHVGA